MVVRRRGVRGPCLLLITIVVVPLLALGINVATTAGPETTVFASHRGVDSPFLFIRFIALTVLYALTSLTIAFLLSALARSRGRALVLALAGLLVLTVGSDLAVFAALDTGVTTGTLGGALSMTPAGAYRGLVFDQVLYVAVPGRSAFVRRGSPPSRSYSGGDSRSWGRCLRRMRPDFSRRPLRPRVRRRPAA